MENFCFGRREWDAWNYDEVVGACRLLGQIGDMSYEIFLNDMIPRIQRFLQSQCVLNQDIQEGLETVRDEATLALALIRAREPPRQQDTARDFSHVEDPDAEDGVGPAEDLDAMAGAEYHDAADFDAAQPAPRAALPAQTDDNLMLAKEQEEADLAAAIAQSEICQTGGPLSQDGLVLLRVHARQASNWAELDRVLQECPLLARCHAKMADAECIVTPTWTPAKLLAPVTEDILTEIPGFVGRLRQHHIIALSMDVELIRAAVGTIGEQSGKSSRERYKTTPRVVACTIEVEQYLTDSDKLRWHPDVASSSTAR
jgi:hypothetical protein